MAARPRVVIVGAGFGGLYAAKALRRAPVDIVLIDRRNYHLFQPLLYQVATAALSPGHIAHPVRAVFRGQPNNAAVIDWGRVRLSGFLAWIIWAAAHLFFLIGFRNRLVVMMDWIWSYLTGGRAVRLITAAKIGGRDRQDVARRPAERDPAALTRHIGSGGPTA